MSEGRIYNRYKVNIEICKALGLDPYKVGELSIVLKTSGVTEVTVKFLPTTEEMIAVADVIKQFCVIDDDEAAQILNDLLYSTDGAPITAYLDVEKLRAAGYEVVKIKS